MDPSKARIHPIGGIVLLLAALFCAGVTPMARSAPLLAGLHESETIKVDGQTREFSYYVPSRAEGRALPTVIFFHGHGDNMRHIIGKGRVPSAAARWMDVAEREKFLVFYPLGLKGDGDKTGWNDCRADTKDNPKIDDVRFAKALIEFAGRNLDRSRVYVTGMSNGGHMTMRVAMEMSEQIAAAASIVALLPRNSTCRPPPRPVPILLMYGTDDPIAPFNGGAMAGERGTVYSARETVNLWRTWNGVQDVQEQTRQFPDQDKSDNSVILERSWTKSSGASTVVAFEMKGAGHTEPSRSARQGWLMSRIQGNQNHDIEMADVVWAFFKNHSLDRVSGADVAEGVASGDGRRELNRPNPVSG